MCQSKAQGGKRCNAYLERQVTTGLVTTTAAVTGTKRAEVRNLHAELVASAIDGPDPTRDEVDQFLTETDFRVRHDPTLDAPVRERISSRLRAAIGRILPSRKTLSAWRTLLSEAWTRSHRKATTGFAAMAMVFSVGACGNTPDTGQATPVSSEPSSQVASPPSEEPTSEASGLTPVATSWGKDPRVSIGVAPREFYGAEKAEMGTQVALDFMKSYAVHPDLIRAEPRDVTMSSLSGLTSQMTPAMKADLKKTVSIYSSSDGKKGTADLWALTMTAVDKQLPADATYGVDRTASDPVSQRQFTSISTRLASDDNLEVATTATFVVRFEGSDGAAYSAKYERESRMYLIPSGDSWLINGYQGAITFQDWV